MNVPPRRPDTVQYYSDQRWRRESPARPRGPFRRNRSLTITLIDIAVVVLIFIAYLVFFRNTPNVFVLEGHDVTVEIDDRVDGLAVHARVGSPDDAQADGLQPVVVLSVPGHDGLSTSDLAPRPGDVRLVTLNVPTSVVENRATLRVTVAVGRASREVTFEVPGHESSN